jgi:hypothetical protein
VRGVEHHGTDAGAGSRHAASTDVVERPGGGHAGEDARGVHGGEDARRMHESGREVHESGHGDHRDAPDAPDAHDGESAHRDAGHVPDGAGHPEGHEPSHDGGPEDAQPKSEYSIPDVDHPAAPRGPEVDDYWRPLSHEEIQDLPVVRDGSHLNADGTLRPNIWYQTGEHDYLYRTNEHGHIDRVIAENLQLKTHIGRLRYVRRTIGKLFGDHAGHLIADWFGGSPKLDNLVSQFGDINRRGYANIERQWARALKSTPPGHVGVDIRIDTNGVTGRPNSFHVDSVVNGKSVFAEFYQ